MSRKDLRRWIAAVALAILVPLVPFLGFGPRLEAAVRGWFDAHVSPSLMAALVVGVLSSDILLPVPSSFVCTLAGARLGIMGGTLASFAGLTLGAALGFALARALGQPLATRLVAVDDWERMRQLAERRGPIVLATTRALPLLAEAAVLLLGAMRLSWRRFWPPVLLANLGLATAYATLGRLADDADQLPVALAASLAVPLLAAMVARLAWRASGDS